MSSSSPSPSSTGGPYTIKDEPIENLRPMKVRVIGAGFSGIYMGIRIPQRLRNVDLQIYEKNEGIGGTWWENRYPGCACDIPSHSYQYSFEPNPDWSTFYAPGGEICAYLQGVAEKYGVLRFVKTSHMVKSCTWDEAAKKWKIMVEKTQTREVFEDEADVLVSARGSLNEISWPDIPGLDTFEGEIMHPAQWNEKYDFKNKLVGVIGGGSSAIQIVPNLQKVEGIQMTCFVRSRSWISSPFGDQAMMQLGLDTNNIEFSPEQRREFTTNPEKFLSFRRTIEELGNTIHGLTMRDSELQKSTAAAFRAMMKTRLASKPSIYNSLVPSFAVGCRRLTPGPGYLEALTSPNVAFTSEPISHLTPTSLVLSSGHSIPLDALICATGFHTSSAPPFPITGKSNTTLESAFTPFPQTYLSIATSPFPNFFLMFGPNSAIGSGSLTMMFEAEGDYIIKCIRKLQKEDYACMTPKASRVRDFTEYCENYFRKTVYVDDCNSWYTKGGKVTGLWPGSTLHCLEALRAPRWEDFEFEGLDCGDSERGGGNRLGWLGNGWSLTQLEGEGDPAWYLDPRVVDVPLAGRPEDEDGYKRRQFSH